jgi:hypothetical protein
MPIGPDYNPAISVSALNRPVVSGAATKNIRRVLLRLRMHTIN